MVRLIFSRNPKQFMAQYPRKIFAVIGPFENQYDKADLREALRKATMEHNGKRRGAALSLDERC